jgi:hypothetical protein
VPQGSVISPHLFNFFCHNFPNHSQLHENYADNFNLSESSPDIDTLGIKLTDHLTHITKLSVDNKLAITPAKSQVTLFSPQTSQSNCRPDVSVDGVPIPLEKNLKWLRVGFNKLSIYSLHIIHTAKVNGRKGNQLLKAISG